MGLMCVNECGTKNRIGREDEGLAHDGRLTSVP